MTGFNIKHDEIECSCCVEPIHVGIKSWLSIRANIPHGDRALVILLYHNWILPDTVYVIFGQNYRILGLYPSDPLFTLLMYDNEDEEPPN